MKKIVFINYDITLVGGVEKVTELLANNLAIDYQVYIISLCKKNNTTHYYFKENIKIIFLNDIEMRVREILKDRSSRMKLKNIAEKEKFDCFLLMGTEASFIANIFLSHKKYRKIFCDHGAIINQLDNKLMTFFRFISSLKSDKIVTLTKKSLDDYMKLFHTKRTKLQYIYNPINKIEIENNYDLESHLLITAGRLSDEKGFDLLIRVAKELLKLNKDWYWNIWGDGPNYKKIQDDIIYNGLENNVFLKGATQELEREYQKSAIYVLTSYREGLPLVLLEAKSNYLPIVSFDIDTGPSEIVMNDQNGFLISPYDCNEMANKINELLQDKQKRKQFSMHAYDDIDKFNLSNIINQWKQLIEQKN